MKSKPTPVASAVALMLMSAAFAAQAQQTAAETKEPSQQQAAEAKEPSQQQQTAEEAKKPAGKPVQMEAVIVRGIRASLQQSLEQKRNSETLVEVITAEDVGKMPDKNVADSLQRVPGVGVATAGGAEGGFGENDRVAIRGTPSFMTLTTLNGHTVSSGDWYVDNITGGGRSVSYSLFPSELIGNVKVYKTSRADLVEGGGVGTVDIETRKPFSFQPGLSAMGSLEGAYTEAAKKTDAQISGLINWKNEDNTVGVLVQAFHEKRHLRRMGQEFLWWDKVATWFAPAWIAANPEVEGKNISLLTGSVLFQQERVRKGGLIDVQVKPTNDLTLDVSAFASRMDATNINANFMLSPYQVLSNNWSNDANSAVPSGYTITGDTITSLTFPSNCPVADCSAMGASVQDVISRPGSYMESKFLNFDADWRVNDRLRVKGKAGTTRGTGHARDYGYEVWNAYSGSSITLHGLDAPATVIIDNAGTFSPRTGAPFFGGWASDITARDKEDYAQADATLNLDAEAIPVVRFGLRSANHRRTLEWLQGTLGAGAGDLANAPTNGLTTFPTSPLPNMLSGAWTFTPEAVNAWGERFVTFTNHAYQSEFDIRERATAAYGMADFNVGSNVSGNFGLRVVRTEVKVANGSPNNVWNPIITENNYTDVLPSANVRVELAKDLIGRAAASRTMARPEIGSLGALSLQDIQRTGTGGNPNLKPVRSNNFDLGVEWYFGPRSRSMVSANAFALDMSSYVTYGTYTATYFNQSAGMDTVYTLSAATNTKARVRGVELAYVQDLGYGFGFNANYTYADGKETGKAPGSACAATGNCDMVGTSKSTYNLGAFFENDTFNARLAYNYRSKFLNGLNRNSAIYQDAIGTLSASLGYKLSKNLSFTIEGKDLNDPVLKSYASTPDQPRAFYKNGRQIYFGIRGQI
ncbi:TonB-dependent receptor [Methylibium rhizosphaerae]|uniref:TonB-dependent receptor n=1 Tax=Methylibium rhizosphaerae TaxID=2570323 RepID=UPI00112874EE|nr:TonB-dependent receptor [Methylibium rhizosphaerae]